MNSQASSSTSYGKKGIKKILFLVPYPFDTAPGQRFRFEQYFNILLARGLEYDIAPFLDNSTWGILYKKGKFLQKIRGIFYGFMKRIALLFRLSSYDYIFIFREAAPIGPPVFEWFMAKVLHKRIIYDFDDAIWLPNTSDNNRIAAGLKWHSKVSSICKWAYKVSCGNEYLAAYARQYNAQVVVNPTTIDTVHYHDRIKDQNTPALTIGWTGTHTTTQYLDIIVPILKKLEEKYTFTFIVISNAPPDFELRSLKYIPWQKEAEIEDLLRFNIGIMPLTDDAWAKGKCGFKALQYMALGIPALVSPVGVNTKIVDHNINGMICANMDDWETALLAFMKDEQLRVNMGIAARQKVIDHFSVLSNTENFLSLFEG